MRSPKTLLALTIAAGLAAPLLPSSAWGAKAPKKTKLTAAQRKADSLRKADSMAVSRRMSDSTRADSLRRDSLAKALLSRLDSLHAADSVRRSDSTALARRTWYFAKVRDQSLSPKVSETLREKLAMEWARSGRAIRSSEEDPGLDFASTWKSAQSSGAGWMLFTTLLVRSEGQREAVAWVFDLSRGVKTDSARGTFSVQDPLSLRRLTRQFARALRPLPADSICRADSIRNSAQEWGVGPVLANGVDSTMAMSAGDSLVSALRASPWATWRPFEWNNSCRTRACIDSAASLWGAPRLLHGTLSRMVDSTWSLSVSMVRSQDDSLLDSVRVLAWDQRLLGKKALDLLAVPPGSCLTCAQGSRAVWAVVYRGDSAQRTNLSLLRSKVAIQAQMREDRQMFSLASGRNADSLLRTQGATRRLDVGISGSDSAWVFNFTVTDLSSGAERRGMLRRGGPKERVFSWAARKLAGMDAPRVCPGPCAADSLEEAQATWALAKVAHIDPLSGPLLDEALLGTFLDEKVPGRMLSLPDSLPCLTSSCVDSIARARSIQKLVWSELARGADSSWIGAVWVRDVRSGVWIDSLQVHDTGAALAAARSLSGKLWQGLVPRVRCDTCMDRDTLESGMIFALPRWKGTLDTFARTWRDSMVAAAGFDPRWQVLAPRRSDSLRSGSCDSLCRASLWCRTGATFVLESDVEQRPDGWTVSASIVDLGSGKVVATFTARDDQPPTAKRLRELAPWTARRLLGLDSSASAPIVPEKTPWGKILGLAIPAMVGTASMILHW